MAFLKKRGEVWYIYWRQNGKKKGKSLKTKSKAIANKYLKEFEFKLAKKHLGQETGITMERLKTEYFEHCKSTKKVSTYQRHTKPRANRFVDYLKELGIKEASRITRAHIEKYQRMLKERGKDEHNDVGLKPNTVRNYIYAASGMLSYAVKHGYLSHNVIKSVDKVKPDKNPARYLSFHEWDMVRDIAQRTYLWTLVATAYYAGFRNSELRFLTWPEVDFDQGVITLHNKEGFSLKNREFRTVPLNSKLKKILLPEREEKGYCFTNRYGKQFDRHTKLSREFKRRIVEPSGLPDFTLHTLRHTFASHLVMKGVSIYKVSNWLGHKDVQTTKRYAHLAPTDGEIDNLS